MFNGMSLCVCKQKHHRQASGVFNKQGQTPVRNFSLMKRFWRHAWADIEAVSSALKASLESNRVAFRILPCQSQNQPCSSQSRRELTRVAPVEVKFGKLRRLSLRSATSATTYTYRPCCCRNNMLYTNLVSTASRLKTLNHLL
jgi:hypothetical protein